MRPSVLLVEDNKINQLVARKVLEKAGFEVDVATSADDALTHLKNRRYQLVLMDVQMPGTDGAEATRLIRSGDVPVLDPEVPVLAMTAYTSPEDQRRFESSGMNGILAKPLDVDELLERVRSFVDEEHNGASQALNEQELTARVGGDQELARDIVSGFANDLPNRIAELRDAVDDDDWETLEQVGHFIAGAALNVSAAELVRFGRDVEAAARNRDVSRTRQLLDRADDIVSRFENAVTEVGYRA
jgi:CheY-like chemotaxis protein